MRRRRDMEIRGRDMDRDTESCMVVWRWLEAGLDNITETSKHHIRTPP